MTSAIELVDVHSTAMVINLATTLFFAMTLLQNVISEQQKHARCTERVQNFFASSSCLHAAFSQPLSPLSSSHISTSRLRRVLRSANKNFAEKPITNSDSESDRQQSAHNLQDRDVFKGIPSQYDNKERSEPGAESESGETSSRYDDDDSQLQFIDDKHSLWIKRNSSANEDAEAFSPVADVSRMKNHLLSLFALPRNEYTNFTLKNIVRQAIIDEFLANNLRTYTHKFAASEMSYLNLSIVEGVNIIGILPGTRYQKAGDEIVLVGAHYDTVFNSNGVNDNGSGMVALLEIIRLFNQHDCRVTNTIMFVAFDLEEYGGLGSRHFLHEYLIPFELNEHKAHFQGAFILDTILNHNKDHGSQDIPIDVHRAMPQWTQQIKSDHFAGDFISLVFRHNIDSRLANHFESAWMRVANQTQYKCKHLAATSLPTHMPSVEVLSAHANLLRSDHVMFWYHNSTEYIDTLQAVLLTDTGPFRGYMRHCYHASCDDASHISSENLRFLKIITETLCITLIDLAIGSCTGDTVALRQESSAVGSMAPTLSFIFLLTFLDIVISRKYFSLFIEH